MRETGASRAFEHQKMKARTQLYEQLSRMPDAELAELGTRRDQLHQFINARLSS